MAISRLSKHTGNKEISNCSKVSRFNLKCFHIFRFLKLVLSQTNPCISKVTQQYHATLIVRAWATCGEPGYWIINLNEDLHVTLIPIGNRIS